METSLTIQEVTAVDYDEVQLTFQDQLIEEYKCATPSELSLVATISLNYTQYLQLQKKLEEADNRVAALHFAHKRCRDDFYAFDPNNACNVSKITLQRLNFLSKELNNSFRRYTIGLQMLRMMKHSPVQVTIKTDTAVIGNGQTVQVNSHEYTNKAI